MTIQQTVRHVLSGAALVSLLSTSVASMEVRGPDPRHAWDYWPERKSAYLGAEGTDDVPVSFTCKESGTVEGLFSDAVSASAAGAKDGAKVGLIFRQGDGTELKVAGSLQENPFNDEAWDLTVSSDVDHPLFSLLKRDGVLEVEVEERFQVKDGYRQRISLKGARQAIEKLQKSCSTSPRSGGNASSKAPVEQSGSPDEQSAQPSVKALAASLKCDAPFKPELILGGLQKEKVIGLKADDGGDGVPRIRPVKPLSLFGMRVITVSGWNYSGRMFSRAPGTAPPVHVGITVEGTEKAVADELKRSGIHVGPYREGKPFLYVTDDPFINPKLVREFKGRNVVTITCSL